VELDLACYIGSVGSVSSQASCSISPSRYSRPVSECVPVNKTLRRTQPIMLLCINICDWIYAA